MDRLDVRIMRELAHPYSSFPSQPGLARSYRAMAKRLEVSDVTLRDRIERMRSSGFLLGAKVLPHPGPLGLQMGMYGLDVSASLKKSEVVAKLRLVDGVIVVQNHHGSYVGLVFVYEDGRSLGTKLELLRRISDADGGYFSRLPFPPCNVPLKLVDWEIIFRLVKGRPATPLQIAREVGISGRTFRRKLAKIVGGAAIFTQPNVNFGELKDAVPADLTVLFEPSDRRQDAERATARAVDDYMFWGGAWEEMGLYSLLVPNPLAATRLAEAVRLIPGVKSARIDLVDEHFDQMELLGEYVERHLRRIRPQ